MDLRPLYSECLCGDQPVDLGHVFGWVPYPDLFLIFQLVQISEMSHVLYHKDSL